MSALASDIVSAVAHPARQLPLALIGTGKVGGALLELLARRATSATLCAVANSRRMLVDEQALDPLGVRDALRSAGEPTCLVTFIERFATRFPDGLIIDLTASREVAACHADWLAAGLRVATANKWAAAGAGGADLCHGAGGRYSMATTVGAGLPVLNTLRELRHAGETVEAVTGVLSGTLSYLFQRHAQGERLSRCLCDAVDRGLTEPDPRDDLSGLDVARKLVIIGRAAGFDLDLSDVEVHSLVPSRWTGRGVDACLQDATPLDAHVAALAGLPPAPGAVLVPHARVSANSACVGVQWVHADSALARCRAGDNLIEIQSSSYQALPLLIQGPGAGAELTASRLLGEALAAFCPASEDN